MERTIVKGLTAPTLSLQYYHCTALGEKSHLEKRKEVRTHRCRRILSARHGNVFTFHSQRLLLKGKVSKDGLLCYVNIEDVLLLVVLTVKFFCYLLIVNL